MALAIRRLGSGRLSTSQFEDACDDARELAKQSDDAGIEELWHVIDGTYGDPTYSCRFTGEKRLTPRGRRFFARCVLFLRSNCEYTWPLTMSCNPFLGPMRGYSGAELLGCDICPACVRRPEELNMLRSIRAMKRQWCAWPFADITSLRAARAAPTMLCGGISFNGPEVRTTVR